MIDKKAKEEAKESSKSSTSVNNDVNEIIEEVYEFDGEQSDIISINGVNMYNLLDESF